MAIPRLETDRLILRGWQESDLEPFSALNRDPEVMRHFPAALDRATSDQLVDRIRRHFEEHGFGLWALEHREDGALLGFTGLSIPRFEARFTPCVEVGWRLAPHSWGHGYATEAARRSLRFGFDEAGLDEIVSFTIPANRASIAVMERLGMSRDPADDFEHPGLAPGDPMRPHVLYRIARGR